MKSYIFYLFGNHGLIIFLYFQLLKTKIKCNLCHQKPSQLFLGKKYIFLLISLVSLITFILPAVEIETVKI